MHVPHIAIDDGCHCVNKSIRKRMSLCKQIDPWETHCASNTELKQLRHAMFHSAVVVRPSHALKRPNGWQHMSGEAAGRPATS